jgi:hypothetical protein
MTLCHSLRLIPLVLVAAAPAAALAQEAAPHAVVNVNVGTAAAAPAPAPAPVPAPAPTPAPVAVAPDGAPGACACPAPAPPPAPPDVVAAPVVIMPVYSGWDGRQHWGIGLRATSLGLRTGDDPNSEMHYVGGGLQLRYRLNARWELELSAEHVTEQRDGQGVVEGGAELASGTLAALFHMRPYARWDWYLLAGAGGTQDGRKDLTDEQRKASAQGHVHLGVGVERRFHHLGIAAELRAVGMAKKDDPAGAKMTDTTGTTTSDPQQSGGQFNLAATYYF